jgi:hypothetical protein
MGTENGDGFIFQKIDPSPFLVPFLVDDGNSSSELRLEMLVFWRFDNQVVVNSLVARGPQ